MAIVEVLGSENALTPWVFVHGFLGRSSMWKPTLQALQTKASVGLVTLPGHGLSPWFSEHFFTRGVGEIMRAIPFQKPFHLVGYSMGARVSLALLLLFPERVARASLIGVDVGLPSEARAARLSWDEAQAKRVEEIGIDAFASEWATLPIFASQQALPKEVREAQQQERREHTPQGISWAMRNLGLGVMPDFRERLEKNQIPMHLITGGLDHKFTEIARSLSSIAKHTIVQGVGHNVALEAPQQLADILAGDTRPAINRRES